MNAHGLRENTNNSQWKPNIRKTRIWNSKVHTSSWSTPSCRSFYNWWFDRHRASTSRRTYRHSAASSGSKQFSCSPIIDVMSCTNLSRITGRYSRRHRINCRIKSIRLSLLRKQSYALGNIINMSRSRSQWLATHIVLWWSFVVPWRGASWRMLVDRCRYRYSRYSAINRRDQVYSGTGENIYCREPAEVIDATLC